MPTWNHLWFVAYLWVYTLLLGALVAAMGPRFDALAGRVGRLLAGWRMVVLPVAVLAIARILLGSRYPQTHALAGDWYSHSTYLFMFALGALLGRVPQFWPRLDALRWPCLAAAVASWSAMVVWHALPDTAVPPDQVEAWRLLMRTVFALFAWCAILAACGFARRHLDVDTPARRYLTEAVFPVFIVHQTLIVVIAHAFKPVRLAPGLEAMMLIALTVAASFGIFEVVRRNALLRPLFGLTAGGAAARPVRPLAAGAA